MSRARFQLEPGYLLNARPYQDSSLLVEAFTRAQGRVALVARGARGVKSKTRALLQPLRPLLLSWTQSGEMGTLTGVEATTPPPALQGDRVFYGWYLNELLLKLTQRHEGHTALFDRYSLTLSEMAGDHAEAALRLFEKHLLAELGYGLHLPEDLIAERHYRCDDGLEPVLAPETPTTFAGASLIALAQETLDTPRALKDAQRLLRAAIRLQLGDKTLETPVMLRQLRAKMSR
jgi:DNA repair protein RecO (recombination protein O)